MKAEKKKICLLLAGGTWAIDRKKNMFTVNSRDDIEAWLATMPELGILSELETEFVAGEEAKINPVLWEKLADIILSKQNNYDAFVIVTKAEKMVITAVALNFLLQNFKKTIVVTGSQMSGAYTKEKKEFMQHLINEQGGLGLRSNLINAVQVANEELAPIAIMFGSRLVAGTKARLEYQKGKYILSSVDDDYLAKVDFGISFKNNLSFSSLPTKISHKFSRELCILDDYLAEKFVWSVESFCDYKAILIFLHDEELSVEQKEYLQSLQKPIILYHPHFLPQEKNFISLSFCTPETAIAKTLWLIENIPFVGWSQMMKTNIIDEFVNF